MTFTGEWNWVLPVGVEGLNSQLCVQNEAGKVLCCVVLLATFYIEHGDTEAARGAICDVFDLHAAESGQALRWFADPDTGAPEAMRPPFDRLRTWPTDILQRFELEAFFHGGNRVDDADPRTFVASSRFREEGELSVVSVTLPLSWARDNPPSRFVSLVLEMAAKLHPCHGYAGLGVIPHVSGFDSEAEIPLFSLARRFRGLELDLPIEHAQVLQEIDCIKGVNWLTLLSSDWIKRVGGEDVLKRSLAVHDYGDGVLLQAGSAPRFGDAGEPMLAYERVAQALSAVRCDHPMLLATNDGVGFDDDEATAWLRRFG